MFPNLVKSILHNIGVILVGAILAFVGTRIDALFGIAAFRFFLASALGCLSLLAGFFLRTWATFLFYEHKMKVIVLQPQRTLLTTGPYRFSRNPLYLGGNVFIFFGAALLFGSPAALIISVIGLPITDLMIRHEEKQLEKQFGEEWREYKKQVPRWI